MLTVSMIDSGIYSCHFLLSHHFAVNYIKLNYMLLVPICFFWTVLDDRVTIRTIALFIQLCICMIVVHSKPRWFEWLARALRCALRRARHVQDLTFSPLYGSLSTVYASAVDFAFTIRHLRFVVLRSL